MSTPVTAHFTVEEFACHDEKRTPYPVGNLDEQGNYTWLQTRLKPLCETLEVIREAGGDESIKIDSGYRTLAYDQKLYDADKGRGNVAKPQGSQHPKGRAADIKHKHLSPRAMFTLVLGLYQMGQLPHLGGVGLYPTFIHIDVRPRPDSRGGANDGHLAIWGGSRPENVA